MKVALTALLAAVMTLDVNAATVQTAARQTFTGIGGSGAWWPYDLYRFPDAVRRNASQLLFSESGLGLSSYRWNIGGGGVGVTDPVRAPTTFYVSQGQYNWSADAQGVYFLTAAAQAGVPYLTAFVNSAPPAFTSNGRSCGGTLVSGREAAVGTYIADVIARMRTTLGINVNYISPMNEPDSSFDGCGQEGMAVPIGQRAALIRGVYQGLSARGLQNAVGIIADETSSTNNAGNNYARWIPGVSSMIAALAHHTYDFPSDGTYTTYLSRAAAAAPGKPTWMTEVCCSTGRADASDRGWKQGYDPTINAGLHFATLIMQAFVIGSEPHYDFWTLVSDKFGCSPLNNPGCVNNPNTNGWQDGLIYYDPNYASNGNYQLYLTKFYWVMKHFGNFVKPGSVRREITEVGSRAIAVYTSSQIAIIALNPGSGTTNIALGFQDGSGASLRATGAYRTSASQNFVNVTLPTQGSGIWTLSLPAVSVTTYTFAR